MDNDNMKKCPYCAEQIRTEAIKCRYCGTDLTKKGINLDFLKTPGYWHRVNEGKKIGGVCTGISKQLESPILIMPLRLFFIITTLFWGFGLILYIIMWLLMPPPTDAVTGPASSGTTYRHDRKEKPTGGTTDDIQAENNESDKEAEQQESAEETKDTVQESETKDSGNDIITIDDIETVENSHDDNTQSGKKIEQFEELPEITDENEKPGEKTASERRKMTPFISVGLLTAGVFVALRIYMGIMESFMGLVIPETFVVFGVIAVASIITGAIIKFSVDRKTVINR